MSGWRGLVLLTVVASILLAGVFEAAAFDNPKAKKPPQAKPQRRSVKTTRNGHTGARKKRDTGLRRTARLAKVVGCTWGL